MQRITTDRVWTAGQRDARGRLLEATTAVNGTNVLVETMHWRANSTLNDYSAARPGTWNETRNYGYNPRGQLTNETLKPSASGSLNASYGYDTNRLGVLTSATFAGSFNNTWLTPSGQPDGFGRVTEEQWDLAHRELWTQGHAPGAGQVSVALDGQPINEVRYDPNQPDGLWEGRMAFGPGNHSLVATATHLSGLVTAATTNAFTASTTNALTEAYDGIGNVTNRTLPGGRVQTLGWDPLGRLVSITERVDTATNWIWAATYDPFSRRLSSTYRPLTINDQPSTIHQFYDPQVEFLEIGVSLNGARTWKIHGPDLTGGYGDLMGIGGLEATVRESDGVATGLLSDAFGNGVATIRGGVVLWTPVPLAGYGPVLGYTLPQLSDYHTLAEVSLWRGQRIDPTGLYWRGTRYYDARAGRFLSPDPLSHAASWDLYSFARNDPVNFFDPDGRFGQQIWTHGCEYGRNLFDLGLNAWIGFVQVQNPIPVQMQTPVPDPITSSGYFGRRLGQATGAAVSLIQLAEGIPLIGIGLGADVTGLGLVATLAGAPGGAVLIGAGTAATGLGVVLTSEGVVGLNNFIYVQTGPPPPPGGSAQQPGGGPNAGGGNPGLPPPGQMGPQAPYNARFAASQLLENGKVSLDRLKQFVPQTTPNNFKPSNTIEYGQKYQFEINGAKIEVKFHSPDATAAAKYPGSVSGHHWTAQIKVDGKLLGADGQFYTKPSNLTHIPIVELP